MADKLLLLCGVRSQNEDDDSTAYATLEVTTELLDTIDARRKLLQLVREKDKDVYEIFFWHSILKTWAPSARSVIAEQLKGKLDADIEPEDAWKVFLFGTHVLLPADALTIPDEHYVNSQCQQMGVREHEVIWTFMPKHTNFYCVVESINFPRWDEIRALLAKE